MSKIGCRYVFHYRWFKIFHIRTHELISGQFKVRLFGPNRLYIFQILEMAAPLSVFKRSYLRGHEPAVYTYV